MGMKMILLGAPGAGKGTQAEVLCQKLGIPTISTGNILRAAIQEGTPVGLQAKSFMDAGKLVPDDVIIQIVAQRIAQPDCADGFILDGVPRTIAQAEALDAAGVRFDRVLSLEITDEEIEEKFRMARSLGFDNINMDLIVGLPGEDKEKVAHTLEKVEALNPDSLTVHSLALKRATRLNLFKDKYQEISFENSAEIMKMTMDSAHRMEMGPYYMYRQKNMAGNFENVGYSREGKAGIYNILIMEEKQSILAAGAGASTKFVFEHGERIERVENVKDLKNYVERIDEMIERKREGIAKWL